MIDPKYIEQIVEKIKQRGASYEYFFDHIQSPDWIKPLKDKGFLIQAPEPIEEGNHIQFPRWPESRYLMRVAPLAPELVMEVALGFANTNNTQVQIDLIDMTMAMPPNLGAKLAPFVEEWINKPYLLLPRRVADYIGYLIRGKDIAAALKVTEVLLKIVPGRLPDEIMKDGAPPSWLPEPRPQIEIWDFEEFLRGAFHELRQAAPRDALSLLCKVLLQVLELRTYQQVPEFIDYSQIWRPAIEPHVQNADHDDIKDLLVSAVRDTAVYLIENQPELLREIVDEFDGLKWIVFKRISLYLIDKFGKTDMALVVSKLTDYELFNDHNVYHEYIHLAQSYFGDLEDGQRNEILGWIGRGPYLTYYAERETREKGQPPSEEDLTTQKEYWQLRRLTVLKDVLPEPWKQTWGVLMNKHSEPEHPDLLSWSSGVQWGPRSPLSAEEIENMPIEELSKFLKEWNQPEGFSMESPGGISRMLVEAVSKNPGKYVNKIEEFVGLDATYVRGLISGLREAFRGSQPFDWVPVLDLFEWVMKQPREILGRSSEDLGDRDPNWGWTRKEIAYLLEACFEKLDKEILPFKHRDRIWGILEGLTADPEPSPSYEEQYGGSNMDPATLSLNTTRGAAFHALIAFAVWCNHHLTLQDPREEDASRCLQRAIDLLQKHLDIAQEPALAIRSVYGWRFGALMYLSQDWADSIKDIVFVLDKSLHKYWRAAWDAFVQFNRPTDNYWKMLQDVYQTAIDRLDRINVLASWAGNANEKLAEHLMVYYWRGIINIESPELRSFWKKAWKELRGHAFDFIGRILYNTTDELPSEIVDRFKLLFQERLKQAKESEAKETFSDEVKAFGWWFASGAFDSEWAFEHLAEVLKLFGKVEAGHLVVKRLSSLAQEFPLKAVSILGALIEGDEKGWGIHVYRDDAKIVLQTALASPDDSARRAASKLINQLGARGHLHFGELLG